MEEREMRPFISAILIAVLTAPAYSQGSIGNGGGGRPSQVNAARTAAENAEKSKAEDKAFTDAIKRMPRAEKKYDPWGIVRETPKEH
jgi:hypothetical protein